MVKTLAGIHGNLANSFKIENTSSREKKYTAHPLAVWTFFRGRVFFTEMEGCVLSGNWVRQDTTGIIEAVNSCSSICKARWPTLWVGMQR